MQKKDSAYRGVSVSELKEKLKASRVGDEMSYSGMKLVVREKLSALHCIVDI